MQKLVWLGQYLRHQSVLVEVLYVEDFTIHFIVLMGSLINIRNKVLILKVHTPELTIVICGVIKNWRLVSALYLLTVNSSLFGEMLPGLNEVLMKGPLKSSS